MSQYSSSASDDLEQGDVLRRTDYLTHDLLERYHPYYAYKEANELFLVLTQACDLVRRPNEECSARYIALAPVRPLRMVLEREFQPHLSTLPGSGMTLGPARLHRQFEDFLRKLFNHNDQRFFFLPAQPDKGLAEDMCAILGLGISLKIEHYDECLRARIAQLADVYQAKLGWLLGQQYSRVGTPDMDQGDLSARIEAVLNRNGAWLPDREYELVRGMVAVSLAADPGVTINGERLMEMRKTLKSRRQEAIDAVMAVLLEEKVVAPERDAIKPRIRKRLLSDPVLAKLLPS